MNKRKRYRQQKRVDELELRYWGVGVIVAYRHIAELENTIKEYQAKISASHHRGLLQCDRVDEYKSEIERLNRLLDRAENSFALKFVHNGLSESEFCDDMNSIFTHRKGGGHNEDKATISAGAAHVLTRDRRQAKLWREVKATRKKWWKDHEGTHSEQNGRYIDAIGNIIRKDGEIK